MANDLGYKRLVYLFSNEREICNCGLAYISYTGTGIPSGGYKLQHDLPCCEGGCSANQANARDEIGEKALCLILELTASGERVDLPRVPEHVQGFAEGANAAFELVKRAPRS